MVKALKTRTLKLGFISVNQPTLVGFESPVSKHLNPANRWVVLLHKILWNTLVNVYQKQMSNSQTGADGINPLWCLGLTDFSTYLRFKG